jgi:hypothetical protein
VVRVGSRRIECRTSGGEVGRRGFNIPLLEKTRSCLCSDKMCFQPACCKGWLRLRGSKEAVGEHEKLCTSRILSTTRVLVQLAT